MSALLVGCARVSTQDQDLTWQRDALAALGVPVARTYVDHGLTGTNRDRPGLREALAACRNGDTLVVTKLDRLARSLPDARDILEDLTAREVKLSIGGSVHDPTDPVGRLLFNVLAMVAEFESESDPAANQGRDARRQGQRASAGPAAETQPAPGGAPHDAAPRRRAQQRRTQRSVRRRTLHRLPSHRARRPAPKAAELSASTDVIR
jgi:DNA invertase Pin-like site-specific DNA recombinase